MRTILTIIFILTLPCFGFCQKKSAFESIPIDFEIKNAGLKVNGSIGGLEGFIIIDTENLKLIKIEGTIDPNTIKTGISLRDNHLKKADYFNIKEFPKISMTSTGIKKNSNRKYVGNFDLTIKDIKKNILIPFTFSTTGDTYTLEGEFSINRLDFGIGEASVILSNTVKIILKVTGNQ